MRHLSPPPGLTRRQFIKNLRDEARENIPPSVYELMSRQVIVVQYERGVLMKQERDVVGDLAQVLPGIDRPHRFSVFLSEFEEDTLAQSLRGHHNTLALSLLKASGEMRDVTNFACRPVDLWEKMPVAGLVTGYVLPFEGASLVLERDREAILQYEAEYEESVRLYRIEQAKLASEATSKRAEDGTKRATTEDSTDGKGRRIERGEGSQVDEKQKIRISAVQKRRNEEAEAEDQTTHNIAGPSSASTSTPQEPSKKRRRTNNAALDPITSDDRDQWIDYVAQSEEVNEGHYDLLNEFLSTTGKDRNWTAQQWNSYLKDNSIYIARQIAQVKRHGSK
ncbi:hypothetical protein FRC00_001417 [Tulasnella sp. 408]|nr:hypothetical protein FRC00_001417 [Tulasnella sp. 408]